MGIQSMNNLVYLYFDLANDMVSIRSIKFKYNFVPTLPQIINNGGRA